LDPEGTQCSAPSLTFADYGRNSGIFSTTVQHSFTTALQILRTVVALGVESPRLFNRKMTNVSFSNCIPGKIDHGEFKHSDFGNDRQPEIAIRKYLYLRKYDRCFEWAILNSNGKLGFLTRARLTTVFPCHYISDRQPEVAD